MTGSNDNGRAGGTAAGLDGERLHRYHDGELAPAERAEVEAVLDEAGGEVARARLGALGDLGAALRGTFEAETASFDAWPAIEKKIGESKVVSLRDRLMGRRAAPIWISTLVAAAAALVVMLYPSGGINVAGGNHCDIESVEAAGSDVTVMKLDGEGTMVVWVHDAEKDTD
jgi:hypothetical protein